MIATVLFAAASSLVQRTVTPAAAGANRLDPDAAILSTASPLRYEIALNGKQRIYTLTGGLEDFRLHDANGSEHPYLLIPPPTVVPDWRTASILPVTPTKFTSGFEADLGEEVDIDRIRLEGIRAPFLKRARLEGSGDREHWNALAAETTVFDLPEQQLRNLEIGFTPGSYRYLRITWDDRSSARVTSVGRVLAELHNASSTPAPVSLPVSFRSIGSEPGKSRYRLVLPGAHLPVTGIALTVTNANVFRDAAITEPRLSGDTVEPFPLGTFSLRRAERDHTVAEDMTIPISFPEGPDLELVVDDADNPPLSITAVNAILAPLPWFYFDAADREPLTATYGDPSLKAPRYDLEAHREAARTSTPGKAEWSATTATKQAATAGDDMPVEGAAINRKGFRFSRSIAPTQRGLTSLVLDADVLSRSSALRDVRIVTANDQQVPYLLQRLGAPLVVPLMIPPRSRGEGAHSIYRFTLPYDSLPDGTRIVITTTAHVFDRTVSLYRTADESRGRERDPLGTTTWRSSELEATPPPLTFYAPQTSAHTLELELDEGDNAPIPLRSAQLELPSFALRFISPGGPLTLLYGNPGTPAPRYDLAILGPRLFGESARDISLTEAAPMIATPEAQTERKVFWVVIAAAVVALLITLQRLLASSGANAA